MNGHFDNESQIASIRWPDATLLRIDARYEECVLHIRQDPGIETVIRCIGYVGLKLVGFWEEIIIKGAVIHGQHEFIEACEQRVRSLPESGVPDRVATGNELLEIIFIDDCRLWVCAGRFIIAPEIG
jgi:hypothetical protein